MRLSNQKIYRRQYGFTLAELLTTLVIVAVLVTMGGSMLQALILNNRIITETNNLLGVLSLARSEAIKRGVRVVICRSEGSICSTDNTGIWETGWIVFADQNNDGTYNPQESIIRLNESLGHSITVRTGGAFTRWIAYRTDGTSLGDTNLANGTFRICDPRGVNHARFIVVNMVGRAIARPKKSADSCP